MARERVCAMRLSPRTYCSRWKNTTLTATHSWLTTSSTKLCPRIPSSKWSPSSRPTNASFYRLSFRLLTTTTRPSTTTTSTPKVRWQWRAHSSTRPSPCTSACLKRLLTPNLTRSTPTPPATTPTPSWCTSQSRATNSFPSDRATCRVLKMSSPPTTIKYRCLKSSSTYWVLVCCLELCCGFLLRFRMCFPWPRSTTACLVW